MLYLTSGPKETEKLAGFLLAKFLKTGHKNALVIALEGELGAGKTVFVKGLAKKLGVKAKIKSPTFNLIKTYEIPTTHHILHTTRYLYHLDCYRLRDHRDLKILGIKEILNNPNNIVLIEWSDRVRKILPKNQIKVHIDHIDKHTRKITIN